jgi:hypothetical protein
LASTAGITFAGTSAGGLVPRVHLNDTTSVFDVSDVSGGFNVVGRSFSGKGTVQGSLNLSGSAFLRPGSVAALDTDGASITGFGGGIGTLAITGDLNIVDSGYQWGLASLTESGAGTNFDQITVGGNLFVDPSTLTLDFSGLTSGDDPTGVNAFWNAERFWKVIDTASNTGSTNFDAGAASPLGFYVPTWGLGEISGRPDAYFETFVGDGTGGFDAGDIYLHYGIVPEPGSFLLVSIGIISLGLMRRHRMRA